MNPEEVLALAEKAAKSINFDIDFSSCTHDDVFNLGKALGLSICPKMSCVVVRHPDIEPVYGHYDCSIPQATCFAIVRAAAAIGGKV